MKSNQMLALCLLGGVAATGCGGGGGGGGGGTGGEGGSGVTTSTTTGTNTTSSTGSGGKTGNHDFATAIGIELDSAAVTKGTLVDASTTTDYYKFTGKKGQRVSAVATAQGLFADPAHDPNDTTVIDTVVSLYDANKTRIAQNDDAWPRTSTDSQAFTLLPADGDYYVTVSNCTTALQNAACAPPSGIVTFKYELVVADVVKLGTPDANEGVEPNDDTTKAVHVTYKVPVGNPAGKYGISTIEGAFQTATDTDVYALEVPADTEFNSLQRAHAEFWIQPITPSNGTGATGNAKVWLVDSSDVTKHIAEMDQANFDDGDNPTNGPAGMSVPVVPGHNYYLFVQHGAGASAPATDFYFIQHSIGSFYYARLEKSPDTNGSLAAPEALFTPSNAKAGRYYVDGNLTTIADVDYYSADATGFTKASLHCNAQRSGSGLRNAKFSLLKPDGSPLGAGNVLLELPNQDTSVGGDTPLSFPAGTTSVILKVEAGSQDPLVTGSYYTCTIALAP